MDIEGQQHFQGQPRSVGKSVLLLSRSRLLKRKTRSYTCRENPREDQLMSRYAIPCHAVVMFLNPLLVGMLQVEYQTRPISPFSSYPINMWSFFISTCIYSLGLAFKLHHHQINSSIFCWVTDTVLLISAVLSPLSLALIFLHCSANWVFSVLSTVSLVLVARRYVIVTCNLAYCGCAWAIREANRFHHA